MDCYSSFTPIFFFHLYMFFYNQNLRASLRAPPPLPGPNLYFDNQGVQASLDAPRLIPWPFYYFFMFTNIFLWSGSPIQFKSTMTNSWTDLKKKKIDCYSAFMLILCFFTYIFFYNWCLRANLSFYLFYFFHLYTFL